MNQRFFIGLLGVLAIGGLYVFSPKQTLNFTSRVAGERSAGSVNAALAAQFEVLRQSGNSACSASFKDSIAAMPDADHLRGSCCSPMDLHRYGEQVEGLKTYARIPEIPPDPYNIEVRLAKKLIALYDTELTPAQQRVYDDAMERSKEKGPCCCKCWRWYVYGGLGKFLIQQHGFTGEQVAEIWNLSDGCGGSGDHASHS